MTQRDLIKSAGGVTAVSRTLDVSVRTVCRWQAGKAMPTAARLYLSAHPSPKATP